ncbi:MAG: ADP-ribosylglycohydrolase family protein [Desulfurococcales archaeon]|nr:ADP-ribosylglycohydrolase family protein [Desulfurococcales archaeon]
MPLLETLTRDVVESVLMGVAVGDALGLPLEFEWREPLDAWLEGLGELECVAPRGYCAYSDDTEMTLIVAESLAERCGVDQEHLAEMLMAKARIEDELRYYGAGTIAVIKLLRKGFPWKKAVLEVYEGGNMGNGAAIRVAPVALFYHPDTQAVWRAAGEQAIVTHAHPIGVEAARIQALAIHYSLSGVEPVRLPGVLMGQAKTREFKTALGRVEGLLGSDPTPREVVDALGNGAPGHESVPAAIYAHARARGDPLKAVLNALSLGGDSDSIASMAAAIAVAYSRGLGGLEHLRDAVEGADEISRVASKLYGAIRECTRG